MEKTIIQEITEWVITLSFWEKYIASQILNGNDITKEIIQTTYQYFKEDSELINVSDSLRNTIVLNTHSLSGEEPNFTLTEINGIRNVNALKEDQVLPICKNLTIVYGENGAGKSGYVRLLNNVFKSKGDKTILPNIHSATIGNSPQGIFKFVKGDKIYNIEYPHSANCVEFNSFSVFDSASAKAHLTQEDELAFIPFSFTFFSKLTDAFTLVSGKLTEEISTRTKPNPFNVYFDKETTVRSLIQNISSSAKFSDYKKIAELTDEEINKHDAESKELLSLKATDINKKAAKINQIKGLLEELKSKITNLNALFSIEKIESLKQRIIIHKQNYDLSKIGGIDQFKSEKIKSIGTKEWKSFIDSAGIYAKLQKDNGSIYPEENDYCLFCHQPLNDDAKELIKSYWSFLASKAENDLKLNIEDKEKIVRYLKEIDFDLIKKGTLLEDWFKENKDDLLIDISAKLLSQEKNRNLFLASYDSLNWDETIAPDQIDTNFIDQLNQKLTDELLNLDLKKIEDRIKVLEQSENEYKDRIKLSPLLVQIENYIKECQWVKKAGSKQINTRKITTKQKELFEKHVTEDYISIFNKECEALKANFKVEISQRGSKGTTLKKLSLKGKTPSAILSEGEQRAIAFADFLSETQLGNSIKGIFFDDPVNSLDHKRRYLIAKRIVEEAKSKQVVIFTHDISFFISLQNYAEEEKIECIYTTIRKILDIPGIIIPEVPWPAMNLKERIKKLNDRLLFLKSLEQNGDVDEYYFQAKSWCGLLRETWERSIEEKLFNDAIQRFNPAIQTQRLKKAPFTVALYGDIEKGMGDCSDWIHDQARTINQNAPNTAELKVFLDDFEKFIKQFKL